MKIRQLKTVVGEFEVFFETGMECLGLTVYEDGHEYPNPQYDPSDRSKGPEFFRGHDGLNFIEGGDTLTVYAEDGLTVERSFKVVKDREEARRDGYRLSIYMKGVSMAEIKAWFDSDKPRRAKLETSQWVEVPEGDSK